MALQTSGAISLNDIAGEFGGTTPHSLSEYYGAASGIPASGTITISDFYGATAFSVPPQPTGTTTWAAYNSGTVTSPTLDFGAASPDRRILVICNNEENQPTSVSSVTVGGVAASRLATRSDWSGSYGSTASIWLAFVPSGTSGTVVANKSLGRIAVQIFILKGGDGVLLASGATGISFQTSTSRSIALASVANTVSLATACNTSAGGGGSCTWTATRTGTLNNNNPKYGYVLSNSPKSDASETLTCSIAAVTFKGRNNAVSCVGVAVK